MKIRYLLVCLFLVFTGCQKEDSEWNPIFEDTSYNYLYTEVDRSLVIIDKISSETAQDNTEDLQARLSEVKNRLLELKDYYIPLTTIRQKIYDAERFFKLKDYKKSENLLNDSKSILKKVDLAVKNKVFDKVILELESMIDEVILSLDDNSGKVTYNKMKRLGEHINLILSKGDMVLSGIELNN